MGIPQAVHLYIFEEYPHANWYCVVGGPVSSRFSTPGVSIVQGPAQKCWVNLHLVCARPALCHTSFLAFAENVCIAEAVFFRSSCILAVLEGAPR